MAGGNNSKKNCEFFIQFRAFFAVHLAKLLLSVTLKSIYFERLGLIRTKLGRMLVRTQKKSSGIENHAYLWIALTKLAQTYSFTQTINNTTVWKLEIQGDLYRDLERFI